jgi:parallel beta-helix repeat protein
MSIWRNGRRASGTPGPYLKARRATAYLGVGVAVAAIIALPGLGSGGLGGGARAVRAAACLPSGTDAIINNALASGGPGATVLLCPQATFLLAHPVRFTAANQILATEGLPTDSTRALLRVNDSTLTTAIDGNDRPGITVENLTVDGNRVTLGYQFGEGLIELGRGGNGQTLTNVAAYDTRSWTVVHVEEGVVINDVPQCQGARILNNTLGPAGRSDGTFADGISLACGTSLVEGNTITDVTDGGIVIFGAPGSTVRGNTIVAATRQLLGGINMVDYAPVAGNYAGTTVTGNVIDGAGAFIKVAVAMGPQVWACVPGLNRGGTVTDNTVKGLNVGYGYAVNGVTNWTVRSNVDIARHVGIPSGGCLGPQTQPGPFQFDVALASDLQPEFRGAQLTDVLGVSEPAILKAATPPTKCGVLTAGQGLYPGQHLPSCDGRFRLTLQTAGFLVLTQGATPLWTAPTNNRVGAMALMQSSGIFAVYGPTGVPVFTSTTTSYPGAVLRVQNDGNVVIYDQNKKAVWSTRTCCH